MINENIKIMKASEVFCAYIFTILLGGGTLMLPGALHAEDLSTPSYRETPAVNYGEGLITENGIEVSRKLWMDIYQPVSKSSESRPAIILSFGGSFHRGGPRHTFRDDGVAQDTSMGDYCRKLAARGYVCFAIDYRLTPELPVLEEAVKDGMKLNERAVIGSLARINLIRDIMGLKVLDPKNPADVSVLSSSMSAAMVDLNSAITHIRKSANQYGIDPEKIVLGGFSAGAITSFAVAANGAPVKGAFLLSGANVLQSLNMSTNSPDILLIQGQNDLPGILYFTPLMLSYFQKNEVRHNFAWVPSAGHFYTSNLATLAGDGSSMSVEERIVKFIKSTLGE